MAATGMRQLGSGHPPLHRFRLGLEFALSGHREVDGMIAHHAAIARTMAEQLSLPDEVARGDRRCVRALGRARLARRARGRATSRSPHASRRSPSTSRSPTGSAASAAARKLARERRGGDFDPGLADLVEAEGDVILSGLDAVGVVGRGDRCRARAGGRARRGALRRRAARDRELRRPEVAVLPRSRPRRLRARRGGRRAARASAQDDVRTLRRAGLVHGLGRLGVSNAISDKPGPLGAGEWERVRLQPYLTDRMLRQSEALAPWPGSRCSTASASTARATRAGSRAPRSPREARILAAADAYQAMREPRPHRAERSAEEAAGELRADVKAGRLRRRRRRGGARRRRPPRPAAPRGPGRADAARGRGPPAARARALQQADRRSGS